MSSYTHRPPERNTSLPATRAPIVCVVDPQTDDYAAWRCVAEERGIAVHVLDSADGALRFARTHAVDLWVINVTLPDRSGCELCDMLRSRAPRTPVFIVADRYAEEFERSAYLANAQMFAMKPFHRDWLAEWTSALPRQLKTLAPTASTPAA